MATRQLLAAALASLAAAAVVPDALAWDAHGHRVITYVALDTLHAKGGPEWLNSPSVRDQVAYSSGEPDRWRSVHAPQLTHTNNPDHYIDLEDLTPYGLTLRTIPHLRNEFIRDLALARAAHPDQFKPINPATDTARTAEWPGFLPHSILEHYGKVVSTLRVVRILETLDAQGKLDDTRKNHLLMARAAALFEMGELSHFVGDAAQPLHTTMHHHGWVGANPNGYTTDRKFHAVIDGEVLAVNHINYVSVKAAADADKAHDRTLSGLEPWGPVVDHIQRSFDKLEPLYALEKSGGLMSEPGKVFITERLVDGGKMLGALYAAAYEAAKPNDAEIADLLKWDNADTKGDSKGDAPKPQAPKP